MIFMLCGSCQADMYIWKTSVLIDEVHGRYDYVHHIRCENNHELLVHSTPAALPDRDSIEYRVLQYLSQDRGSNAKDISVRSGV